MSPDSEPVLLKDAAPTSKIYIRTTAFFRDDPKSYSFEDPKGGESLQRVIRFDSLDSPMDNSEPVRVRKLDKDGRSSSEVYHLRYKRGTVTRINPNGTEGEEEIRAGSYRCKQTVYHISPQIDLKSGIAQSPRPVLARENLMLEEKPGKKPGILRRAAQKLGKLGR